MFLPLSVNDYDLDTQWDISELLVKVVSRMVDEHFETFQNDKQAYIAEGLRLLAEMIE